MGTLFTGALLGSIVTLLLKWGADSISETVKHKRGIRMLVFQEKMQTDKIAMSWYQEALDNYVLLQGALRECADGPSPVSFQKLCHAIEVSNSLMKSKETKLNPVYAFDSFYDLEEKYKAVESAQIMNDGYVAMGKMNLQYDEMLAVGAPEQELIAIKDKYLSTCRRVADAIDNQICLIAEIQNRIRARYQKYLK